MDIVIGATGVLGFEIAQRLAAAGEPLAALVRATSDASKLERLKTMGIALVQGDLKARSTLDACCKGVTTVISTASSTFSRQPGDSIATFDHEGQLSLIEAARAAGVRHFVLSRSLPRLRISHFSGRTPPWPGQTSVKEYAKRALGPFS